MGNNERISNQVIIHGVLKDLKDRGYDGFTARPWNYFMPDSTLWWLVPSTDWPSYKHGKLVLFRNKENYRTGFHIEKGISNIAGQMLSSKSAQKLCIKPDWVWYDFLSDLSDGTFENRLKEISKSVSKPLRIAIQASSGTSEYDPYAEKIEGLEIDNIITFEYQDGELICIKDELKGEMRKYGNASSLADLKNIFENKEMDWFWIDLYVLFEVEAKNLDIIKDYALCFVGKYGELFGY